MKLHLPLNLYRALLLALCAVPALLHADNDELITTNDNTENEQITGYTNINGDIQYTDSFIRENNQKGLKINALVFEELMDVVFYNNYSTTDGGAGDFRCNEDNALFISNGDISFKENSAGFYGGAIYNDDNSSIIFDINGDIAFKKNTCYHYGGAINNNDNSTITLSNNKNITFEANKTNHSAGAIRNEDNSKISLSSNENISFEANISNYEGGAIHNYYNSSSITFDYNGDISFKKNSANRHGGAISEGTGCSITFNSNGNITFVGNSITCGDDLYSGYGGAIYNDFNGSNISFDNNGNIFFKENSVTGGYGGAIYNSMYSSITFNSNGNISFEENNVTGGYGGAIYNVRDSTIIFSKNGNIYFDRNNVTDNVGGAVYNSGSITFGNNGNITFERNSVTSISNEGALAVGGAIYNSSAYNHDCSITFNNNSNITFEGNSATSTGDEGARAEGGAINTSNNYDANSTITFNNNGNISFEGNCATSSGNEGARAEGGAICNTSNNSDDNSTITFNNNGNISFEGNCATSSGNEGARAEGGAICNTSNNYDANSTITFNNNGNISFEGNCATSSGNEGARAEGGAICNTSNNYGANSTITFNNNGNITFRGNSVTGTRGCTALGGAIYQSSGDFILSNNGNVLFEKNIEISGDTYRLRSIYSTSDSTIYKAGNLILGAADHKKIEFRDSIYSSGTTSFNADYVDISGNTIKQTGDIIFTGAYTEAHLKEAKGGIAGTADEILASRTSELTGTTTLYGGRLRIEDGAIIKGSTLDVAENANATVLLRHGTLDLGSYSLDISANSTLSAIGENTINAGIYISKGGTLQLALDMSQVDSAAVLTTIGALNMRNIAFDLTGTEYLVAGDYKLLTRTEGTNYDISGWTLTGVSAEQLRWENGTLYYTGGHTWNHEVTDNPDSYVTENLYGNLIINGGDMTLNNLIGAIQDKDAAGYGHGNGHIVINRGNIHLAGAGEFDGKIIFNGDFNYIRNLFIEKDLSGVEIELNGSTAAANNVNVDGEHTMEIENIYGEGSINKTGVGEMVIHGHGHKIGGMMHVQEGSVTFTAGSSASAHGDVTEINELVVGNHEEKIAKVKVDKDTKVKGNKLHLDGKNAVVTNEGTMEFSGEVTVEAGHLNNQGSISKVTLEGGTVSGSGSFDGFEMNGGKLIVGNSLGLQAFTDAVELNEGMIIFSLSDAATAATAETFGWDSAAYSTMDLGGNALTLSENVDFVLEIGGHALESLVAEDGATLTFSLNLIQNIASESLTLDEEAFATLLDNTKIIITADAEGLSDSMLQLAGIDITEMLSNAEYSYEGNTLVLSGTVTNDGSLTIPEPTTATLSLLALAALAARRRRK